MRFVREYGVLVVGVELLLASAIGFSTMATAGFGWTAYVPLQVSAVNPQEVWLVVGALGLALSAGWIGYRIGRTRRG